MDIENNSDYLRVLSEDMQNPDREPRTITCKCLICNSTKDVFQNHLRSGAVQSCGCISKYKPTKDYTGKIINGAIALGYVGSGEYKFIHTECGHSGIYPPNQIRGRKSSSKCRDCWIKTKVPWNKRHGKSCGGDRTYSSWLNMRRRCYEPNNNRYYLYGARGIGVCERWRESFDTFLSDMGECPNDCSLDRVDVNKDYSPENCKWSNGIEQSLNKRVTWKIKISGEWMSLRSASERVGIGYKHAHYRIKTLGEDIRSVLGDCVEDYIIPNENYESIIKEL